MDDSWWLGHVHLLCQVTIQERGLDVEVVYLPALLSGNGESHAHRVEAHDWSEDFIEVNTYALHVPFRHGASLVLHHLAGGTFSA